MDVHVPDHVFHAIIDAFHNDIPLFERRFFQPWRDLEETIKAALEVLQDIVSPHEMRCKQALKMVTDGRIQLNHVNQRLKNLTAYVNFIERVHHVNYQLNIRRTPHSSQRNRALWSWLTCLPETTKQLRAGRPKTYIIEEALFPLEDKFIPGPDPEVAVSPSDYSSATTLVERPESRRLPSTGGDWWMADSLDSYHASGRRDEYPRLTNIQSEGTRARAPSGADSGFGLLTLHR